MKISDVAKLTGVTVRTLHYYDKIGLLKPGDVTEAGYRIYNESDLAVLQQILFFRELDFSLEDIRKIMQNPAYDKENALQKQKELLLQKRNRLDGLLSLVDKILKGKQDMSFEQFDTTKIDETKKKFFAVLVRCTSETNALRSTSTSTGTAQPRLWRRLSRSIPVKEKLRLSICPCLFRRRSASSPYPTESAPRYLPR